jgi:hypothetical protein
MATTAEVFARLQELGYRPSLLQMTDAVLFFEGPNDVAAIRIWWRKLFDEEPEPLVALLDAQPTKDRPRRTLGGLRRTESLA